MIGLLVFNVSAAYGAIGRRRNLIVAVLAVLVALSAAPLRAEPLRIVALGDSLTQGYGLLTEEGLVPQMEAWLRHRGHDVAVMNAGVSGDTTAGGLSRVAWALADGADALIVALGGNDLLRGIDPAVSRSNLAGILDAAQNERLPVLLVGLPAPGNYGPEFKRDFEAMYVDLAEEYGTLLVRDMLRPISEKAEGAAMADFMQSDMIHPNARGVGLMVEALGPFVEDMIGGRPEG